MSDEIVECPCYRVCSAVGAETGQWCRYRKSDLPPPGMHKLNPKDTWCPPGVQAAVLMLARLLAGDGADAEGVQRALAHISSWARALPLPKRGE